jgi:hypothetical protein
MKKVPYSYALKYTQLIIGEIDLSPLASDTLRRQTHDYIARMLEVDTDIIKRAAFIIERLAFGSPLSRRLYSTEDIAKRFKANLDEIYKAKKRGEYNTSALIAVFTFNAIFGTRGCATMLTTARSSAISWPTLLRSTTPAKAPLSEW